MLSVARLRLVWRDHPILTTALIIAIVIMLFQAGRFTATAIYWANPAHRDVIIQSWMTPGYVARSYRVEPHIVFDAIPYQPIPGDPRTIAQIAEETGRSVADIAGVLQTAIAAQRAVQP